MGKFNQYKVFAYPFSFYIHIKHFNIHRTRLSSNVIHSHPFTDYPQAHKISSMSSITDSTANMKITSTASISRKASQLDMKLLTKVGNVNIADVTYFADDTKNTNTRFYFFSF